MKSFVGLTRPPKVEKNATNYQKFTISKKFRRFSPKHNQILCMYVYIYIYITKVSSGTKIKKLKKKAPKWRQNFVVVVLYYDSNPNPN